MRTLHKRRSAQGSIAADRDAVPQGWMCEFVISAPDGAELHPTFADLIEDVLCSRAPVVRCRPDEITVMCNVPEFGLEQAAIYADGLADRLVGRLEIALSQLEGPTLHQYRRIDEFGAPSAQVIRFPCP